MKDGRIKWVNNVCPFCGEGEDKHKFNDECLQIAMLQAKKPFLENEENRKKWYHVKVVTVMDYLYRWYEDHKDDLKKGFKKEFVPSVLQFYAEKGYVSGKQLNAAESIISESFYAGPCYEKIDELHGDMLAKFALENFPYDYLEWKKLKPKVRRYYKEGWLF